ncbi:MAG: AAA-15 domain-containing protein [Pseudomonas helleri]|jgi:predicted ATP-dependent endonuclease of OLD family|uniref:AAA family ATPase n=1 Tax=Pseudomonas helleri TaxID=1608996 RepID=A0A6A7Z9I1_9PSED|nr:AAA family ATPase [Pseudomonas helleri]MQT36009.1 AAA family ATPase [Pseudomonas helleri]MQU20796.1 AAA family ATPase [Pseudomonas helleri]MQU43364.1 AAA family ATPase [Pseudomonas helleri]MQU59061.1 AAA family ATPase [Pseudomonas helleri]
MSKILDFEIKNYKGIVSTRIELSGKSDTPIVMLIGLNESGKTTILEAISQFVSSDKSVSSLYEFSPENNEEFTFIPASQKGSFKGTVSVAATVQLDEDEITAIEKMAEEFGLLVDREALGKKFRITKEISFAKNPKGESTGSLGLELNAKRPREAEFEPYAHPDKPDEDLWERVAELVVEGVPTVAYFPTFLINVPEEIELAPFQGESYEQRHYREILAKIIASTSQDVDEHINRRIAQYREKNGPQWLDTFYRSHEKNQIDAVFKKVSQALTTEVIGGWQRVFSRETTARRIELQWSVTGADTPTAMVSFAVSNGDSDYKVSERSIGFRWFFTFLLLTQFKGESSKQKTIYVFDEPAANLHSRAQAELLKYFDQMVGSGDKIIYSTHSHHMVDPRWLSGAYIVENQSAKHDEADGYDLEFLPAKIAAIKYKQFINNFPGRTYHFQPVLERLQYVVPEIVGSAPFVILEGISDYYAFKTASVTCDIPIKFTIVPGVGSSALGNLISFLMGRDEKFIVLLDDDKAGRQERERYRKKYLLPDRLVITYADIDTAYETGALEFLVGEDSLRIVQDKLSLSTLPSKDQYGLYLAEQYHKAGARAGIFSPQGLENLHAVLRFLARQFEQS